MIYLKIYIIYQFFFTTHGEQYINSSLWEKLPEECGRTRFDTRNVRIIDGDKAELGQFPWAVRIGKTKKNKNTFFFCGGSLINRYYVLSAAHCEDDGDIVRIGESKVEADIDCDEFGVCAPPHQDIKVKKYKLLNFQQVSHINDLSLIELEEPVKFNEFVRPICLPHAPLSHKDLVNRAVKVAGWGVINTDDFSTAKDLMYITAPVVDSKECDSVYPYPLEDSQLCIGYTEGGKDSCGGDSGGPASMSMLVDKERRSYLIGVVSFGLTMCGRGVAVYTDVSYFLKWILEGIERS